MKRLGTDPTKKALSSRSTSTPAETVVAIICFSGANTENMKATNTTTSTCIIDWDFGWKLSWAEEQTNKQTQAVDYYARNPLRTFPLLEAVDEAKEFYKINNNTLEPHVSYLAIKTYGGAEAPANW